MEELLPKIWLRRIQKYWEKFMPSGYPDSNSEFSLTFESDEVRTAVMDMENSIGKETCPVVEFLPEGYFLSSYVGTYNVATETNGSTLLSPEKANIDATVVAMQYDDVNSKWSKIDGAQVNNEYVWGDFSGSAAVAVFEVKREIYIASSVDGLSWKNPVVCCGNPVLISTVDGKNIVKNTVTGKTLEITNGSGVIGGTVDGSYIKSTNVAIKDLNNKTIGVYAGSFYWTDEDAHIDLPVVNVYAEDSTLRAIVGAGCKVRNALINMTIKNCTIASHIGCIETYCTPKAKDSNGSVPVNNNVNSRVDKAIVNVSDSYVWCLYGGGNSGYAYVEDIEFNVTNCSCDYLVPASSNGTVIKTTMVAKNTTVNEQYVTCNRGRVVDADITIESCTMPHGLWLIGDPADSSVNGAFEGKLTATVNTGDSTFELAPGTNGGVAITADQAKDIFNYVKVSRAAGDVTISDDTKAILGNKLYY